MAPEPTFPTDIRARTRSDIGRSADGKAETETTSVTADSRKLDEGETLVLAIHPLEIGSLELGKRIDRPFERCRASAFERCRASAFESGGSGRELVASASSSSRENWESARKPKKIEVMR